MLGNPLFMHTRVAGGISLATWSPVDVAPSIGLSNGNLTASASVATSRGVRATQLIPVGSYFWEVRVDAIGGNISDIGIATTAVAIDSGNGGNQAGAVVYRNNGYLYVGASGVGGWGSAYATGDVIGVAAVNDGSTVAVWYSKAGVWQAGGNPSTSTSPAASGLIGTLYPLAFPGTDTGVVTVKFSAGDWVYPAPSGFSPLP